MRSDWAALRGEAAKNKDEHQAAEIEAELPEIPKTPRIWTSDATPEKLGELLAEGGESLAWLSSEGGVFDLLQGRYTKGISNLDLEVRPRSLPPGVRPYSWRPGNANASLRRRPPR